MNIVQELCNSTNYRSGRTQGIKFLVIHYSANNGDRAEDNAHYFANNENLQASAHYFVDENEVFQSVPDADTAWHCGTSGTYKHAECRNANSLGIELCSEKDNDGNYYFTSETVNRAIDLAKTKMNEFSISIDCVIRHYDVTGKICPAPFVNDESQWTAFKANLTGKEGEEDMVRYKKLSDIPNNFGFRNVIEKLMNAKIINGDGSDKFGNDDVIDLSHDQVRSLIFEYNGGAFDRKLVKEGLEPAVSD